MIKNSIFAKSFKKSGLRPIKIAAYDFLFYLALTAILVSLLLSMKANFEPLQELIPTLTKISEFFSQTGELPYDTGDLSKTLKDIKSTFYFTIARAILIVVGAILLSIVNISLFKGLIWSSVLEKKFSKKFFNKFLLLNLLWYLLWIIAAVLFFVLVKVNIAAILITIELALMLYFTPLAYSLFDENRNVFRLIKEAFSLGTKRFFYLSLPYLIVISLLLVLFFTVGLLGFIIPFIIFAVIFWVAFLAFRGWARLYISMAVGAIKK